MLKRFRDILKRLLTTRVAWPIVASIGLLCTASILALQLSSPDRAQRQQVYVALGVAVILLVLWPRYQDFGRIAYVFYGVVVVLLGAVFFATPRGGTMEGTGATRWFQITETFQLQPSEISKIAFVRAVAWYLRHRRDVRTLKGLVVPFVLMLVPFGLILKEPDLGTALLFPLTLFAMLIAAGAKLRHLLAIALVVVLAAPGAYPFLTGYQQKRVQEFVRPWVGLSAAPQQEQSVEAIGAGGAVGMGAQGAHYIGPRRLPEAYTDFIFAVIGVQWGFAGCVLILLFYLAFFAATIEIAASTKDDFGRLMAVGLASMILFQAMINIAMTVALAPVVGIALPFVSYGGSSMLMSMLAAGLLLNVSVRRQTYSAGMPQYAGV